MTVETHLTKRQAKGRSKKKRIEENLVDLFEPFDRAHATNFSAEFLHVYSLLQHAFDSFQSRRKQHA